MKNEIIRLRNLGYSYKQIVKELNCALSTVSYHCKKHGLDTPNERPNKFTDELLLNIEKDLLIMSRKDVTKKYSINDATILKKFGRVNKERVGRIKKKHEIICLQCGEKHTTENAKGKFCNNICSAKFKHKQTYDDFLNNNDKYCEGNYTPKSFKDFFLNEQNNKCAVCGIEPIWANKNLVFVLDHIDGDASNNKRNNLRLICPNCDSQTSTFKSKTKNSTRRNYWKEKILRNNIGR